MFEFFTGSWLFHFSLVPLLFILALIFFVYNLVRQYKQEIAILKAEQATEPHDQPQALMGLVHDQGDLEARLALESNLCHLNKVNEILENDVTAHKSFASKYIVDVHAYYDQTYERIDQSTAAVEALHDSLSQLHRQMSELLDQADQLHTADILSREQLSNLQELIKKQSQTKKLKRGHVINKRFNQ